ncbi:helix-turn-helix domain-containing protein [Actinomadura formosensis]|uniref:helix-turn-helix domain-containing protein n=1 Tax=Actinomadura formosensis TaxID=60706 RepID=UPI00082F3D14|nr:helix-turn-helix domain-containing protein [Actinomadura formosensis]
MSVPTRSDSFTPRVVRPADMDWVKFDAQLARDGSVDPVDKALYAALASFVDKDGRDSDPDPSGEDIPTRAVLAACIGRSVDTVDRATKRLERRGLVRVERRRDPNSSHANLPSVYELLDHELWDERAAARAEARKAARREREQPPQIAPPGSEKPGGGGRMGAAVPLSLQNVSLSDARESDVPAPRTAPEEGERETSSRDEQARAVAAAWTAGTGLPRVPGSERKIREQAAELLAEGHDPAHLASVARWMAAKGWRDLGYALTAPDAPAALSATSEGRQRREWCGECSDPIKRQSEDDEGRVRRCPTCHPLNSRASTLTASS